MITKIFVAEFLDRLAESPRLWCLRGTGQLRRYDGALEHCPWSWHNAVFGGASLTGPRATPWEAVWHAADNERGHDPAIRKALLDACGLS